MAKLSEPLGSRAPAAYERAFVDEYIPNESALVPRALANTLYALGRAQGRLAIPAVERWIAAGRPC